MTDHHIREAERQYEEELAHGDRVEAKIKEILPEVLANPNDHDIDVDLLDSGDFVDFLYSTFAKPNWHLDISSTQQAMWVLFRKYEKLAEKAAEELALIEIYNEDSDGGYEG